MKPLKLINVNKTFKQGDTEIVALSNVNLEVDAGEIILIMGPSGSGKTTLLSIAGGILKPNSGTVELKGINITALNESKLPEIRRKNVGFIFQSFNLLSALTTRENVEVVANLAGIKSDIAKKKAEYLLTLLGLSHRLNMATNKLSGGEKQRVAIARALINDPEVILADEPTANLDSKMGHEVMTQLRKVAKENNKSVLIASHDNRIRDLADKVLWLEDGKFKDIGKMQTDPVCNMFIEKGLFYTTFNNKEYYFCSNGCLNEFLSNPEKYAK